MKREKLKPNSSINIKFVELLMEITAVLLIMEELANEREFYDSIDDDRREDMILEENNFFNQFRTFMNEKDYEQAINCFYKFKTFKLSDREEMLQIEALDDKAMDKELKALKRALVNFHDEYNSLLNTLIRTSDKEILLIETIDLISDGLSMLDRIETHVQSRKRLDTEDDIRRDNMITKEDYYFLVIPSQIKKDKIEQAINYFYDFNKFKLEDREEMIRLENLDDAVKASEINLLIRKIEDFKNKTNSYEKQVQKEKKHGKKTYNRHIKFESSIQSGFNTGTI